MKRGHKEKHPDSYRAGRSARQQGHDKNTCPCRHVSVYGAWWLAGWNDQDMELAS